MIQTGRLLCQRSINIEGTKILKEGRRFLGVSSLLLRSKEAEEVVNNILYNTPSFSEKKHRHILHAIVTNEPGVLSRIAGTLAARGFNIDSLVVSSTEVSAVSRMTIVLKGKDSVIEQARKQLEDLVPVWAVLDYSFTPIIERELLLIKVSTEPEQSTNDNTTSTTGNSKHNKLLATHSKRQAVRDLAQLFGGRVVDVSNSNCTVELCTKSSRVEAFIQMVRPFGIVECCRSGLMALPRAPIEGIDRKIVEEEVDFSPKVDATQLPPG